MKLTLLIMLGLGEPELPKLKHLISDKTSWLIMSRLFDKVVISVDKSTCEKLKDPEYIGTNLTDSFSKKAKLNFIAIDGGTDVGKNRYDSLNQLIKDADESDFVMMLDPDDNMINYQYWEEVIKELRMRVNPPYIVEFNYVCNDFSRVQMESSEQNKKRFIEADPWDSNIYDEIDGYKFYNPKIRVSGIQKIFKLKEINPSLFLKNKRYEDGLVFADLLSRSKTVGIVPFAAIVYNRDASSILTQESTNDEELHKLLDMLEFKDFTSNGSICHIPFVMMRKQIMHWVDKKS